MALFRFPKTEIDIDPDQKVAVKGVDGKFYEVSIQDIIDLANGTTLGGLTSGVVPRSDGDTLIDGSLQDSGTHLTATVDLSVPTKTPASAAAAGVAGTIAWDASYVYVCTATNTWKRAAIATWP